MISDPVLGLTPLAPHHCWGVGEEGRERGYLNLILDLLPGWALGLTAFKARLSQCLLLSNKVTQSTSL